MITGVRKVSWAIGASSVLLPVLFGAVQLRAFESWAASRGGVVCGMPIIAIVFLVLAGASGLSLAAVAVGVVAYRREASPRSPLRKAEVVVLSLPLVTGISSVLLFIYAPGVL